MEPMRAVMDAISETDVREVVLKKGTQVGYTEFLLNTVGYFIDLDPCPILWLLPDQKAVDEISKNRLDNMLRDTPRLAGKVKPKRSRDSGNTIAAKQFPGGRIAMVGSHAPNDIASRPIRVVICDETDKYAISAGLEGDPIALAAKRQTWFWNRKTIKGSSPTVKGRSIIDREYRLSDMRECWVGCPHCGEKQVLRWSQVKWDKERGPDGKSIHKPETAAYQCEHCGTLWDDDERYAALGKVTKEDWRPTAPFRGIAGFHYPQFLSTVVTLSEIVAEFLTAFGKVPGAHPDVEKMKVWTNTVLAECWEEQGETVDKSKLETRGEPYGPLDLPDEVLLATAGVDVQGNRLEVQIIGWGAGEESWPALYVVIPGDPAQKMVWDELDELLKEPLQTVSGRLVRIRAACIDAGGHYAAEVHDFCKNKVARRIYPIVGKGGPRKMWPVRQSRSKHGHVYVIGVDTGKDQIYGRLAIPPRKPGEPNPGFIHFPLPNEDARTDAFNSDYFSQLTVEKVETRYREGRAVRVWTKKPGDRNEALDTFVYGLVARTSLGWKLRPVAKTAQDDHPPSTKKRPPPLRSAPAPELAKVAKKARTRRDPASIARMFHR
mgnify:CR=1 FL=1